MADNIFVIFNPNPEKTTVELPEGDWNVYVSGNKAGTKVLKTVSGEATVEGISAMVLCQDDNKPASGSVLPIAGVAAAVAALGAAVAVVLKKRKK